MVDRSTRRVIFLDDTIKGGHTILSVLSEFKTGGFEFEVWPGVITRATKAWPINPHIKLCLDDAIIPLGSTNSLMEETSLAKIVELTQRVSFQAIIIGDDRGTGLTIARKLPQNLRRTTIVLARGHVPQVIADYGNLGIDLVISSFQLESFQANVKRLCHWHA